MATKIMFHGCIQEFQDEKYGEQQRVFNSCVSSGEMLKWRCTGCGTVVVTSKKKMEIVA